MCVCVCMDEYVSVAFISVSVNVRGMCVRVWEGMDELICRY